MKTKRNLIQVSLPAALLLAAISGHAQPVNLGVQQTNGQPTVSWPSGLSLVQPQKCTNLVAGVWQDYGAATTASNLTDAAGTSAAYYRLRFLAPNILAGPQSQTNATGSNITFNVTAAGTAPMSYQWQKANTSLVGKTAVTLSLTNLAAGDAASYRVVITNRVGSVTSAVAVLTLTNPPTAPAGIYMGSFAGQADNGGFAMLVRTNGQGVVVVGYNTPQAEGVYAVNFPVAVNGVFSLTTQGGGSASGTLSTSGVTGNFTNSTGNPGAFSGTRKPGTGIQAANAGYYVGTFGGFYSGSAYAVLAADGTIFFYTYSGPDNDGGGFGTISAGNVFSATTVPDNLTVAGTLNPATHVISGSYSSGGTALGTFSISLNTIP